MTREEAIEILCAYGVPQDEKGFREALDIAIEALTQDSRKFTQESTQDLISRQDAIEAIPQTSVDAFENCRYCNLLDREQVIDIIKSLPSADRPTGEWVDKDGKIVCSLCGNSVSFSMIENSWRLGRFCQSCGAKMGG